MLEYFTEINSLLIWQLSLRVMGFIHQDHSPVSTMFLPVVLSTQYIDRGTQQSIFRVGYTDITILPNPDHPLQSTARS